MSSKITKETTVTVQSIDEVKQLLDEASNKLGLKSFNVFVWADKSSGIEVKTRLESDESETAS
jgi:Iap family predicted aminopeptidase